MTSAPSHAAPSGIARAGSPPSLVPRAALAAAMSAVMPGLGQLANAQINKAIWIFLAFATLAVPAVAVVALYLPGAWMLIALVAGLVATIALWLYAVLDAWRVAFSAAARGPLARPWQTSGMYALVFAIGNLLALPLLIGQVREQLVEPFRIPSGSMAPSVLPGDLIFADKRYNRLQGMFGMLFGQAQGVRRGDIAIFANPNDRSVRYIKRIVGLPGDRIDVRGAERAVWVNGVPLAKAPVESHLSSSSSLTAPAADISTESSDGRQWSVDWSGDPLPDYTGVVPPGQVFVLGDRRTASTDSRQFGTVALQDVVGRARQVWFSADAHGVRWNRLGLVLR